MLSWFKAIKGWLDRGGEWLLQFEQRLGRRLGYPVWKVIDVPLKAKPDHAQVSRTLCAAIDCAAAERDAALAAEIAMISVRLSAVESAIADMTRATVAFEINADGNLTGVRPIERPDARS